jgi:alcohol dehydrogenase
MAPARYAFAPVEAVLYGRDAMQRLPDELDRLGARRVLLVTTRSVHRGALFALARDLLGDRCAAVFPRCRAHLPLDVIDDLMQTVAAVEPDAVVSIGGGSVSDAGKAAAAGRAIGARTAADLQWMRVHVTAASIAGHLPDWSARPIPQVAVPTTLSAAEYCGAFAMSADGVKDAYSDVRLTPRVVVLDPNATRDTPDRLWAATGMRAMDHAVESFVSRRPSPPTDATAALAARLLFEHLPASVHGPDRDETRLQCLVAGWLSMFGFHNAGLGLSHAIGHQLGARWGVPHGETSCVTLPTVARLLAASDPHRVAELARASLISADRDDATAAEALARRLESLLDELGLPRRIRDLGVPEEGLGALAAAAASHTTARFAPLAVDTEVVFQVVRDAY